MKRFLIPFLLIIFLICGCGAQKEDNENTFTFYYVNKYFQYGQGDGIIVSEDRESTSERKDLMYLMSLYLIGPAEESHSMPLPVGTRIYCETEEDGSVTLELSNAANLMTDSEFTLACTCLSLTCFEISDVSEITIVNGERSTTISRDNFLLSDDHALYSASEEPQ